MGGVTDTYCRYEAAGDQYCSRIISGLPLFLFRFAILPLIFKFESDSENQVVEELILTLFTVIHEDLWAVVRYGIKLVALCEDWLEENLPADHSKLHLVE